MDASRVDQVSALLAEGLDHYGCDEIGDAIEKWREVLRLDPGNAEAIDYLQTADRRDQRRLPMEDQMSDKVRHIVHAAHQTIVADDWEGALDILGSAGEGEPTGLEFEATVDNLMSRLNKDNLDDTASVIRLYMDIRGYGPVKELAVSNVREKVAAHAIMQA